MKLSDYCDIGSSKRIFAKEYVDIGIPFYRGEEISELSKGNKNIQSKYISFNRYAELKKKYYIPSINDILITAVGTIGNIYQIEDNRPFYYKDGNLILLYNYKGIYPKYLYYFLNSTYAKQYILNSALNSVQKALTIDMLKNMPVTFPDIEKQKILVNRLESIDSKIKLNNEIIKTLKNKLQTVYSYWFHQFDFPDENGKPYRSSGGEMIWNDELKRELPKGWNPINLMDLFTYENGIEPSSKNYIVDPENLSNLTRFYRVADFSKPSNTYISSDNFSQNCLFGDVLVSFDGAIGKVAYTFDGIFSSGYKKVKSSNFSELIAFCVYTDKFIIEQLNNSSSSGSILKHAFSYVKYINIPYSEELFKEFDQSYSNIFSLILNVEKEKL